MCVYKNNIHFSDSTCLSNYLTKKSDSTIRLYRLKSQCLVYLLLKFITHLLRTNIVEYLLSPQLIRDIYRSIFIVDQLHVHNSARVHFLNEPLCNKICILFLNTHKSHRWRCTLHRGNFFFLTFLIVFLNYLQLYEWNRYGGVALHFFLKKTSQKQKKYSSWPFL